MNKRRIFALVLAAVLLLATGIGHGEPAAKTVRVGCVDIDHFMTAVGGTVAGYGADLLKEIGTYTGWRYEYVSGTWNECMEWLKEGKIDLLFPAAYSQERAEDFLFSSLECCIDYVVLLTNESHDALYYEDFAHYDGISVGMIEGNYLNDCFQRYAAQKGFSYRPQYYSTGNEMFDALDTGAVDAIVTGNLSIDENSRILAKFDYMLAYFITGKQNAALMGELNEALFRIRLESPTFMTELYDRYYAPFATQAKVYTRDEAEFIAQAQPVRVVCDSDNYPFEWYDADTQAYCGIDVDILKLIARESGLTLEFVPTASLRESWQAVGEGRADLIAGVYVDELLAEEYRIAPTISYLNEISNAVCRRGRTLALTDALTVAITESFVGTAEYLQFYYPGWTLITRSDTNGCLQAVAEGKADLAFVGAYALENRPLLKDFSGLSILSGVTVSVPMMLGVSNGAPSMLLTVLNKAIRTLSQSELQQIVSSNTLMLPASVTLQSLVTEHPAAFACAFAALCAIVAGLAFLFYRNRMQQRYAVSLQKKNEELSHANQATSAFFSQLSHDMRTPMNAVLSFSRFGLESKSLEEAQPYFQKIQNSGEYLLNLINDTLEISKLDTGKLTLRPEPYTAKAFTASLRNILQAKAEEKGVSLVIEDTCPDQRNALFDKLHLQQIFVNLLNNAIKFTPSGGRVSLTISVEPSGEEQARVRFVVADTGIGMGEDFIQKKLYQPFEQEQRTESGNEVGTGLGLSIVKNLVELMQGTIACDSRLGGGTRFTVVLPTTFVAEAPAETKPQAVDDASLRGKHILLCEDHPINREIIVKLLQKRGMEADTAANGQEGLALFQRSEPYAYDAILMDLRMPVMDGFEATRSIRALDRRDAATVPIIAITANVFDEDVRRSRAGGMDAHLAKPVDTALLYATLGRLMGRQ